MENQRDVLEREGMIQYYYHLEQTVHIAIRFDEIASYVLTVSLSLPILGICIFYFQHVHIAGI